MKKNSTDKRESEGHYMALGISFGLIAGSGIGVLIFANPAMGVAMGCAIGLCVGMGVGTLFDSREK